MNNTTGLRVVATPTQATVRSLAVLSLALCAASACGTSDDALTCDDLMPVGQAHYADLEARIMSTERTGCGSANCHGEAQASGGYRLDTRAGVYDALTSRPQVLYGQVSAGEMPLDGPAWSDDDLRLFRTWYCNGSFPNE